MPYFEKKMTEMDKDEGKKMSEKDKGEGEVPGGLKVGDKKRELGDTKDARDDDVGDTGKHVSDGRDVGGGEGGDDYVISADRVAAIHGVRMVPFHMNMPALIGWEKGSVADTGGNFSRKSGMKMKK